MEDLLRDQQLPPGVDPPHPRTAARGNWKIRPAAGLYFKREWCTVVDRAPADLNIVRYWDLAATKKPSSTIWIGRSASSSATIGAAAIGCWIWCGREPTRGTSNGYWLSIAEQGRKNVRIGFGKDPGLAGKIEALHPCAHSAASR